MPVGLGAMRVRTEVIGVRGTNARIGDHGVDAGRAV